MNWDCEIFIFSIVHIWKLFTFYKFSKNWLVNKKIIYRQGWNLRIQDEFEELKNLSNKPFSEEILKMLDVEKKEQNFNSTWIK